MGIEHTEIIVDFRHRPYGGARIVAGGFLVDGNRRRQPGNLIHVRLIHLPQKLAGVSGQGLYILSLALRINGIKCQGRLPRPREAGKYDQLISRKLEINIFQIVLPSSLNHNAFFHIY